MQRLNGDLPAAAPILSLESMCTAAWSRRTGLAITFWSHVHRSGKSILKLCTLLTQCTGSANSLTRLCYAFLFFFFRLSNVITSNISTPPCSTE